MQMSDTRLFKATRRTIRAEVTLIIVIVISFSWSAYALYRLALGTSESIFDLGFNQASRAPAEQAVSRQQPVQVKLELESERLQSGRNLTDQLAVYKSQILRELLERQKQLLGGSASAGQAQDQLESAQIQANDFQQTHSFPPPPQLATSLDQEAAVDKIQRPVNIEELAQWRGGYKMPTTIDYLLKPLKEGAAQRPASVSRVDRMPSSSSEYAQQAINSSLVPLRDAPSLMQLSNLKLVDRPSKSDAQITRIREFQVNHNEDDTNEPVNDEVRTQSDHSNPDESNLMERQSNQLDASTTTTTTMSPYESEEAETTTLEPNLPVADDETTPSPSMLMDEVKEEKSSRKDDNNSNQDEGNSEESRADESNAAGPANEDENESGNGNGNGNENDEANDDDGSMARVKNTVHAIDEEVDRMTQPSLGMASQQDKSFDYKNTVQFDDSLPASIQRELDADIKSKISRSSDSEIDEHDPHFSSRKLDAKDATDLQVADNRAKLPSRMTHAASPLRPGESDSSRRLNLGRALKKEAKAEKLDNNTLTTRRASKLSKNEDPNSKVRKSRKSLTSDHVKSRKRRSIESNLISKTLDTLEPIKGKRKWRRRSDDQEDESEGDEQPDGYEIDDRAPVSNQDSANQEASPEEKLRASYQTITSNDPTLQELLAHKRLLDELQQSQVPSPVLSDASPDANNNQLAPQRQQLNSTFSEASLRQASSSPSVGHSERARQQDHQPADTQYTVDHGLLLYPASDEERHHKSMSKKSKKAMHKKAKKKMTVAMKKGGHKKKKHKKEEKKYLKEKKFKGAKKGKKMSKGKGGKGGKKGKKYYKDKGFKKKGFKNIYVKNEFGQKKSYFDEFRDKDFKKKWKNFDDKYKYAQMKKWQAKDVKGAKKMKKHGEMYKKYDKGKWKKKYHKHQQSESAKKKKKVDEF